MAQYEDRWIDGSRYTVPVGLRADWKPGQPYNLPTTPATTTNSGSSSNTSGNTSGTYYPDGTFVPKSGSSSSNTNKNSPKTYHGSNNTNQPTPQSSSSFDWESLFDKLVPKNNFVAPSESQMRDWASSYASSQVNPLITAIQNNLAQQLAAQETAKSDIEAAYAGLPEKYAAQLEEARRTALESAIARGMGRSGVADWQTAQYSKPILESQRQSEADKAAKLAAIANTIAALNTTAQNSLTAAEQQRGALEAARMGELEQWAAQMAATGGQNNFNNMMQMANLYNNNQANSQNLILQLLPLLMGGAS